MAASLRPFQGDRSAPCRESFDRTRRIRENSGPGDRPRLVAAGTAAMRDDLVGQDKQKLQAAVGDEEKVRRYLQ
jgi:hypothetical protein